MKIFITGGTGLIGSHLTKKLQEKGHFVTILTRKIEPGQRPDNGVTLLAGNPQKPGPWQEQLRHHDAVVNLAGASIFCRWTAKSKQRILASRLSTTKNIVEALQGSARQITLLTGSAIGYYGFDPERTFDEDSAPGTDFLSTVAQQWEAAARPAEGIARVVYCRIGLVLSPKGGALAKMLPGFRLGLGAPLGTGNQWFSWISMEDLCRALLHLIETSSISGPVNLTAPHPVTNLELSKSLGRALHRPVFLPPIPAWFIRMLFGEFGDIVINGQKVMPKKLLDSRFHYRHELLRDALNDLI